MSLADDPPPFDEEFRARCLAGVNRRLGARMRSALDAEDVMHESFAQMLARWRHHPLERGNWSQQRVQFLAELRIREHARRLDRRGRPRPLHELDDHQMPAAQRSSEALRGILDQGGELAERIRREMDGMRAEHAWTLMLRVWFKAPWDKVAFVMEQPSESAARSLYSRALKNLAARLERGSGPGSRPAH